MIRVLDRSDVCLTWLRGKNAAKPQREESGYCRNVGMSPKPCSFEWTGTFVPGWRLSAESADVARRRFL
jgi:hypothetical protein